ncbi:MAG: ABC transporter substrate-binding protein [Anaerolineales bacterium]
MGRSILCGLLLMAMVNQAIVSVVHAQAPRPDQAMPVELHEGLVGEISKLNPLFANLNPVDRDISALIYEGLTDINEFGEVVPDLATGWIASPDGVEYVFQLRQDVLWQDGTPFSAADVAYTIRTLRHPDFPGDPALRDFWRTVEMQVLDDYTVRFRLVQPLANFPERLRQGIAPAHALEGAPVDTLDQHPFNLSPIGTGPYQIETLFAQEGQISGISLRVAPNYRQRPEGAQGYALDRLVFRTYPDMATAIQDYLAGAINSLGPVPLEHLEAVRGINGVGLHTSIAPTLGVLIFNWQADSLAYFRDARFRQALAYAVDHEAIVRDVLGGRAVPAESPILPGSWAFDAQAAANFPQPDAQRAQALLERVSFEAYQPPAPEDDNPEDDEDPEPPPAVEQRRNFNILVSDDPGIAAVAFELATVWNSLGFSIELDMVSPATQLERLQAGDFDAALVEYSLAPFADPDQFSLWHSGQYPIGQNYGAMNEPFINSLLAQARIDPVGSHRAELYATFQREFAVRVPALVLYHPVFVYAPDVRLEGVQLDFISRPSDRFRSIQNWHFAPPT